LRASSEVFYQISTPYVPTAARGARWDDPAFAIAWPREPTVISDKDAAWPAYDGGTDGSVPPIG
jgi:dTDP-4-dehydrorhamnose 3,5-epimerase